MAIICLLDKSFIQKKGYHTFLPDVTYMYSNQKKQIMCMLRCFTDIFLIFSSEDPCHMTNNPCLNGGTCSYMFPVAGTVNAPTVQCTCPANIYYGTNCEFGKFILGGALFLCTLIPLRQNLFLALRRKKNYLPNVRVI